MLFRGGRRGLLRGLPLSACQRGRNERIRLLRKRRCLPLVIASGSRVRISRRDRQGGMQAVLLALLLLDREHAIRGLALDVLLHEDLVLDRAVQLGEVGLLGMLELDESRRGLRVRLQVTRLQRGHLLLLVLLLQLLQLLLGVHVGLLTHVRKRGRVQWVLKIWLLLVVVLLLVGTGPESERLRAVPRRSVVTRHGWEMRVLGFPLSGCRPGRMRQKLAQRSLRRARDQHPRSRLGGAAASQQGRRRKADSRVRCKATGRSAVRACSSPPERGKVARDARRRG